jgi:exodeoxyribonuclease VII small subunit
MATNAAGEFENALKRLEEIVGTLERENVGLDESVKLFREGKELSLKCERLLKDAQTSIEAAAATPLLVADDARPDDRR